jgi:hypothetical protein
MLLVSFRNRQPARVALVIATFLKSMIDGNPVIEYETLTLPERLGFRHFFQVFENAAL